MTGGMGFRGQLHGSNPELPMSALGHRRMSALPPTADVVRGSIHSRNERCRRQRAAGIACGASVGCTPGATSTKLRGGGVLWPRRLSGEKLRPYLKAALSADHMRLKTQR
jgi:hypothetical protein